MNQNIIWVASYPKSGNTWIRSILSSLFYTKKGTFSFEDLKNIPYFDSPYNYNFLNKKNPKKYQTLNMLETISENWIAAQEEFNKKNTIKFFKTHSANITFKNKNYTNKENTRGVIYLVRDPRDVVISYSKHLNKNIEEVIKIMQTKNYVVPERDYKYPSVYSSWDNHIFSWNALNVPKILIRYEDLINKPLQTVFQLIFFLKNTLNVDLTCSDSKIINALQNTSFEKLKEKESLDGFREAPQNSSFFNVGKKEQWKKNLNQTHIREIKKNFEKTMLKFGYQ